MIYLLLTILFNTILFVLFKLFPKYGVNALQAIVVNYITCVITGSIFLGFFPISADAVNEPWFGWAVFLGFLFIGIFNFIAYCTRRFGITTSTVANKLSLVIPVVFSVMLYNEKLSVLNVAGLLLALPAVYFSTRMETEKAASTSVLLPAFLFLLSGSLDTLVKYAEHNYLQNVTVQAVFPVYVFCVAAIVGILLILVNMLQQKTAFNYKNIIAGIALGIPNYFSIYYFIRLLNSDFMKSSAAIPVNNIGIVLTCAFVGIMLFKEPFTKSRVAGLILAVVSIILISYT